MQPVDVGFDDSEFGEGSRLDDANCSVIEVLEGIDIDPLAHREARGDGGAQVDDRSAQPGPGSNAVLVLEVDAHAVRAAEGRRGVRGFDVAFSPVWFMLSGHAAGVVQVYFPPGPGPPYEPGLKKRFTSSDLLFYP